MVPLRGVASPLTPITIFATTTLMALSFVSFIVALIIFVHQLSYRLYLSCRFCLFCHPDTNIMATSHAEVASHARHAHVHGAQVSSHGYLLRIKYRSGYMYLVAVMHISILSVHVPIFKCCACWTCMCFFLFSSFHCVQVYLRDLSGLVMDTF